MTGRRNAWFGTAAVVLSLTASLLAAEGLLRLLGFRYGYALKTVTVGEEWRDYHMFEDDMFESDPVLFWRPKRSSDYYVPFNSYGYRGREVGTTKGGDELRVLAIGDSNTLGPAEYSWPGFVQDLLDASCPARHATVLNAGVYGYSSYQGVRRFEEGLRFAPDVLLVSFGWNDVVETANPPDKLYGERSTRFASVKRLLARHVRIYHLMRSVLDRLRAGSPAGTGAPGHLTPRVSEEDYRTNLTDIVTRSLSRGIVPILLTRPHVVDTSIAYSPVTQWRRHLGRYNEIVRGVARRFEVPLVDAYAMFAGAPDRFVDDNHLKEPAARQLAERVRAAIAEKTDGCAAPPEFGDSLQAGGAAGSRPDSDTRGGSVRSVR